MSTQKTDGMDDVNLGFDNAAILAIQVLDNSDVLVDVGSISQANLRVDNSLSNRDVIGYMPDFRLRGEVCRRLIAASNKLPEGYLILVKDCLRPRSVQEEIFSRRLARIRAENPALSHSDAFALCARYIAPPDAAGHCTGGALDVVLCTSQLAELDMGTPYDVAPEMCDNACYTNAANVAPAAKFHREILVSAMAHAGFANYPYEWWHWSYGDRYWAFINDKKHAIYSDIV